MECFLGTEETSQSLSPAVINTNRKSLGEENIHFTLQLPDPIPSLRELRQELRAGPWIQDWKQRPWRSGDDWLARHSLLRLLSLWQVGHRNMDCAFE